VRRDGQILELVPREQGAGQMDGIERTNDRREWVCCTPEDRRAERDQGEALECLEDRGAAVGHLVIVEAEAQPRAIDRAKALEADELAGDGGRDPRPHAQAARLPKDHAEKDR